MSHSRAGSFCEFPNQCVRLARRITSPERDRHLRDASGSISLLAGCFSGIEPLYALAYQRSGVLAQGAMPAHPLMLQRLEQLGSKATSLIPEIEASGRFGHLTQSPEELRKVFRVAREIHQLEHVQMQAVIQQQAQNAVSKTINLPTTAAVADVRSVFTEAYRLGCNTVSQ